jgi:hypothetical protein
MESANFIIEGVDFDDGSRVTLHECESSSEARRWIAGYVKTLDQDGSAGGWNLIEAYDMRNSDEPERIAFWASDSES